MLDNCFTTRLNPQFTGRFVNSIESMEQTLFLGGLCLHGADLTEGKTNKQHSKLAISTLEQAHTRIGLGRTGILFAEGIGRQHLSKDLKKAG